MFGILHFSAVKKPQHGNTLASSETVYVSEEMFALPLCRSDGPTCRGHVWGSKQSRWRDAPPTALLFVA